MARKMIEIVADFDVFLHGVGQIGTATKIKVPTITQVKETHTSGTGDYDVSVGQLEKMEAECVILQEHVLMYVEAGLINDGEVDFVEAVKAGSDAREGLYEFKGVVDIEVSEGERKGKKETTLKIACNRAYHSINGLEAYHIDFENNICRVGGVDSMEYVRSIIGS